MRPTLAIVEMAEEHDRKECIALYQKAEGANRELAQWLLDHPTYTAAEVARWNKCHERKIQRLRAWARDGFDLRGPQRDDRRSTTDEALKTNDNFEDDDFEPSDEVEDPAKVLTNILDSIKHAKSVAEAYRKILKASSFDREAKVEIHNAINQLIVKWRAVQSTINRKVQNNGQNT